LDSFNTAFRDFLDILSYGNTELPGAATTIQNGIGVTPLLSTNEALSLTPSQYPGSDSLQGKTTSH
jgi:hypothetical protein